MVCHLFPAAARPDRPYVCSTANQCCSNRRIRLTHAVYKPFYQCIRRLRDFFKKHHFLITTPIQSLPTVLAKIKVALNVFVPKMWRYNQFANIVTANRAYKFFPRWTADFCRSVRRHAKRNTKTLSAAHVRHPARPDFHASAQRGPARIGCRSHGVVRSRCITSPSVPKFDSFVITCVCKRLKESNGF